MKKTLFILSAIAVLFACKKEDQTTPVSNPTTSNQDSKLVGTWVRDSTKHKDWQTSVTDSNYADTLFISTGNYIHKGVTYHPSKSTISLKEIWDTKADSLFLHPLPSPSDIATRAKFIISGSLLDINELHKDKSTDRSWYHKI